MVSGLIINRFWFSYILFLVFLGGILVLFIYVTSLASNEIFNLSIKLTFVIISFIIICGAIINIVDFSEISYINNFEINEFKFFKYTIEITESTFKIYIYPTCIVTCLLINYLLFTLIVVVKITIFFFGPIRNLN